MLCAPICGDVIEGKALLLGKLLKGRPRRIRCLPADRYQVDVAVVASHAAETHVALKANRLAALQH